MDKPTHSDILREQRKQARGIHGGRVKMLIAWLGVKLSRLPIPTRSLRRKLFRSVFGQKYDSLNEEEAEFPIEEYRTLNAVFTRGLKPECRPVPETDSQYLVPCDSRVQETGAIDRETILTAKGIDYTLSSLSPEIDTSRYHNGRYAILFLSPVDCHRVFAPQAGRVEEVLHIPGYRLLVHPPFQRKEYPTFTLNERMVFRIATPLGSCLLIMVAGWGVGDITLPWDRDFQYSSRTVTRKQYDKPVELGRCGWLATFNLGSTVIVITEPNSESEVLVKEDEKLEYGQPLFHFPKPVEL
jgi:phosphatidylserine decarboxylase